MAEVKDKIVTVESLKAVYDSLLEDIALQTMGVTATAEELNILSGVTVTTDELNRIAGATSTIQEQINQFISLPTSTEDDNGKFLRIVDGIALWQAIDIAEEVSV